MTTMKFFWDWFDTVRGNLSVREVERLGGAPRGRISNVYQKKEPSALVCETIAEGLNLSKEEVFRRAGLLDSGPLPPVDRDTMIREMWEAFKAGQLPGDEKMSELITGEEPTLAELIRLMKQLPAEDRQEILRFATFRFDEYKRRTAGNNKTSSANAGA